MGLVNSKEAKMTSQKIEQSNSSSSHIFKKMGHSRRLILYFRLFNTPLTVNKCSI